MNQSILQPDVQAFLRAHLGDDPAAVALSKSPFPGVSAAELAQQLDGLKRCQKKLPLWFSTPSIYFPHHLALEQCSSALTAQYKSRLIPEGSHLIDLTGGFGVDAYYFAQEAGEVVHCEQQEELSQIAAHNAQQLGANNIRFMPADGPAYLQATSQKFKVIYVDPSRRVKQQKVFRLADCEPDLTQYASQWLGKADQLLIKAAPLLDITAALNELPPIREVHILSIQNDCKELLFLTEAGYKGTPTLHCAVLSNSGLQQFAFTNEQETKSTPVYNTPKRYLYEPDAALMKGGCFKYISKAFGVYKLHQHTHLYTSDDLNTNFIGRTFEVVSSQLYSSFKKTTSGMKANVSTRNFPLKPEALKKKHQLKDGGDHYLFFCTGPKDELLVVQGRKI